MSVQAIAWALDQDLPGLPKSILVVLANYANADGAGCFPGQKRLAFDTGWDERSIRRGLLMLEQRGLIARHHRQRTNGARTSDEIALNLPSNRTQSPHGLPDSQSKPTGQRVRGNINRQ